MNKEGRAIHSLLVTGYKAHELGIFQESHQGVHYVKKTIENRLRPFIEEGTEWIITSGQLGVEQWAADVVFSLKETAYPHIKLAILPPFEGQEANWSQAAQERYAARLAMADFVECISKRPYEHVGQLRQKNDFLVQRTDGLLVLYDEEKQGSPLYYIASAKAQGKPIFYISPEEVEETVRQDQYDDFL